MEKTNKKSFFSFALYKEGLKKIRVAGIAFFILITVLSAIVPLTHIVSNGAREMVDLPRFSVPMILILIAAPVFVHSMFSFLNTRSEADFYHAIPHTRVCVYVSFTLAVITWLWGIILSATAVTALFWVLDANATLSLSCLYLVPFAYALLTLFLAGIMMVAMMLTGTTLTNLAMALLLFGFVRVLGVLVKNSLAAAVPVFSLSGSIGAFLEPDFFALFLWFKVMINGNMATFFAAVPMLIYTAVVSVLLLAAGGWLYHTRRSEMTGQSAPNKVLHHVFRCLITLPFALILTNYILTEYYDHLDYFDITGFIILLALALLVYYLYELITTKKFKSMIKCTPMLAFVLLGCLVYCGTITLVRKTVLSNVPKADEIKEVSIEDRDSLWGVTTFETLQTGNVSIADENVNRIVADALAENVRVIKEHEVLQEYELINAEVGINLKNGRRMSRNIHFSEKAYEKYLTILQDRPEYKKEFLKIPSAIDVICVEGSFGLRGNSFYCQTGWKDLWNTFSVEYAALSEEQKLQVKDVDKYDFSQESDCWLVLTAEGNYNGTRFVSRYRLTEAMPKTRQAFMDLATEDSVAKDNRDVFIDMLSAWKKDPNVYKGYTVEFTLICADGTETADFPRVVQLTSDSYFNEEGAPRRGEAFDAVLKDMTAGLPVAGNFVVTVFANHSAEDDPKGYKDYAYYEEVYFLPITLSPGTVALLIETADGVFPFETY